MKLQYMNKGATYLLPNFYSQYIVNCQLSICLSQFNKFYGNTQ
jgi:hypothetical protein